MFYCLFICDFRLCGWYQSEHFNVRAYIAAEAFIFAQLAMCIYCRLSADSVVAKDIGVPCNWLLSADKVTHVVASFLPVKHLGESHLILYPHLQQKSSPTPSRVKAPQWPHTHVSYFLP